MSRELFAGVEAGGTKILCALADRAGNMLAQSRLATNSPQENFPAMARFFAAQADRFGPIAAGGIASFGPLELDRDAPQYGTMKDTPKLGWSSCDVLAEFSAAIAAPAVIDTDVNCAALAELVLGAGRGLDRLCYVTVGTGVGVGIAQEGRIFSASSHPEAGHIRVPRAPNDGFVGICSAHVDCLEGLASGPAMALRWGVAAEHLPSDHPAWQQEAHYIASLCVSLAYTIRPQRIVLGGGVMEQATILDAIRAKFAAFAAGYALDRFSADPETYLCAPQLRDPSPGLAGALALARGSIGHG